MMPNTRTNCLWNMIISVFETVYKTTCIRLMMTDGLTANPQNIQLETVLEFQKMGTKMAPETRLRIETGIFLLEKNLPSQLETWFANLEMESKTDSPIAGVTSLELWKYLSNSQFQLQIMGHTLMLKAILERFAYEFGGAAIVCDSNNAINPQDVEYSSTIRDVALHKHFKGQPYKDSDIFDYLVKSDAETRFKYPRGTMRKLRELRNAIAHDDQPISIDETQSISRFEELHEHINAVIQTVQLLYDKKVADQIFPKS